MIIKPLSELEPEGQYSGEMELPNTGKYTGRRLPDDIASSDRYLGMKAPQADASISMMQMGEQLKFQGNQDKMFRSVKRSYRGLEQYRDLNEKLVSDYAGSHYQGESAGHKGKNRYVNLMNQAVEAYQMLLAANRPRVIVTTNLTQYRGFAASFQHAINALIKEIRLEETLEKWVMDAFFCMGVVKTHLADAGLTKLENDIWMDPGKPFASNIALDDFVYDMSANKWSECKYAGDMYRLSYDDAVELFGEEAMKDHQPGKSGGITGERVDEIGKPQMSGEEDFEPMVDLADIWVPRHGMIYTYVVESRRDFSLAGPSPVAVEEWDGDEGGPYHLLGFNDVPEHVMFSSPASHLEMLDSLVNDLYRKASRQARRQKDVHLYTAAGASSAQQIQLADDGEWVNVQDTADVSMMKQGGVDASNFQFMTGAMSTFDRMAGNLQAQLGLAARAETLGQEQLVHGAASQKVDKMGKRVAECVTRLVKSLGQMLWADEFKQIVSEVAVPGAKDFQATYSWKPGDREGNFIDYNFDIDAYSMQYQGPRAKLDQLNSLVQGVYLPMAQMVQQQGGMIDLHQLTKQYSELLNLPELMQIVKFGYELEGDASQQALTEVPTKSPTSTRNYVRTNVSAASQQDPMQQIAQQMGQQGMQDMGPQTPGGMT